GVWKTRIAEPEPAKGYLRWHGDEAARRAVYANRARLKSGIGRETMRRRGELVERSFAHVLDRGGMRRAWLRGRENIHKRYLIHVAGFSALHGQGTPREAAEAAYAFIFVLRTDAALAFGLIVVVDREFAAFVVIGAEPTSSRKPGLHQRAVKEACECGDPDPCKERTPADIVEIAHETSPFEAHQSEIGSDRERAVALVRPEKQAEQDQNER